MTKGSGVESRESRTVDRIRADKEGAKGGTRGDARGRVQVRCRVVDAYQAEKGVCSVEENKKNKTEKKTKKSINSGAKEYSVKTK